MPGIRRVSKLRTWADNIASLTSVFYKDQYLRDLMCIPKKTSLDEFQKKYYVRGASADEIVTNEEVRILWFNNEPVELVKKNVKLRELMMDIYVKDSVLHTATNNILQFRYELIEDRLVDILMTPDQICGIRFINRVPGYDMSTKTIGYSRYRVVFLYKTTI